MATVFSPLLSPLSFRPWASSDESQPNCPVKPTTAWERIHGSHKKIITLACHKQVPGAGLTHGRFMTILA